MHTLTYLRAIFFTLIYAIFLILILSPTGLIIGISTDIFGQPKTDKFFKYISKGVSNLHDILLNARSSNK